MSTILKFPNDRITHVGVACFENEIKEVGVKL